MHMRRTSSAVGGAIMAAVARTGGTYPIVIIVERTWMAAIQLAGTFNTMGVA
jgi:hypothetical protein